MKFCKLEIKTSTPWQFQYEEITERQSVSDKNFEKEMFW